MLAYITKASNWDYREFKEVNSVEDILKIYKSVVIEPNYFKGRPIEELDAFSIEDRKNLIKAEIQITIYDSYIE